MYEVKTYIVMQRMNVPTPEGDTLRVVDVFLTRKAADSLVDRMPGTFVDARKATK